MQTILGAGGDIGTSLAKELKNYTEKIRLVSRNPQKVNDNDELFVCNLLNSEQVKLATKDSEIVYLAVGLPYDIAVWEKQWPIIMKNVIEACVASQSRLVFLDNVYAYAKTEIPNMTEHSQIAPTTRKGKVRAQLLEMLNKAQREKSLKILVGRSADFYGPNAKNGFLNILIHDNFKKSKSAFWQSDANKIHNFTYTLDAAKALAILGNTDDAYGQVWHLPTSNEALTGKDFVNIFAEEMNVKPKYMRLSPLLLTIIGWFSKDIEELKEMQYQNNQNYVFDSSKFNKAFNFSPTNYHEGIREIVKSSASKI
ncbi:Nucleoside-diphosphate-sugar epimerase [Soonwooa buanensis]|uniref:Nucleoside-diphosphate-sugar epimerase n=1 Tax=Soonwooa buanensis TaxID=619805 RepID=A0A1T5EU36_9FLAO|nr:NAD-dependent epimerase/dehydratase family protein [Soonwooa buanensis]SKB87391.1 Nucleoside-diphosphate-sugar epimerase [Soonwooa buanensis]